MEELMTIVSKTDALSTLPQARSGIAVRQLSQWIGSILQPVGAQIAKVWLRLESLHQLDRLDDHLLRDIGLRRVNLPGATPGLPNGTTGRIVQWSSLEPSSD
jgi:uncharacterized protein YjiS (DUF1127 family)